MNEKVKSCVDARTNFFNQYYMVPDEMKSEVEMFFKDINKLGNNCNDATTFEEKFISEGLSDIFNTILPKCTPKQFKMTKEQRKNSANVLKGIIKDNKKEIIKDAAMRVADRAFNEVKDDAIDKNRKRMIENETFDDYSKLTSSTGGRGMWTALNTIKNKFIKK